MHRSVKGKALCLQSLFLFCATVFGQNIYIDKPARGEALQETQVFELAITDGTARRVDFYLNGRLIQGRKRAPWVFKTSWNTSYENKVRFIATFEDGSQAEVTRTFREIQVDVAEELEAFQVFPFLEREGASVSMTDASGKKVPKTFEKADLHFEMNLVILLDVSGSMKFELAALSPGFHALLKECQERGWSPKVVVFDRVPRLMEVSAIPLNLEELYRGEQKSVVWDALATACELFPKGARRVMLMVSDAYDDGSGHNGHSAGRYLKGSRASLIWSSPSTVRSPLMERLVKLSGGFMTDTSQGDPLVPVRRLIGQQYHLLAPDAAFPIKIKASRGAIYYPRWTDGTREPQ